jgi:hypothetical protein
MTLTTPAAAVHYVPKHVDGFKYLFQLRNL